VVAEADAEVRLVPRISTEARAFPSDRIAEVGSDPLLVEMRARFSPAHQVRGQRHMRVHGAGTPAPKLLACPAARRRANGRDLQDEHRIEAVSKSLPTAISQSRTIGEHQWRLLLNAPIDEHDLSIRSLQDSNDMRLFVRLVGARSVRGADGPALGSRFARLGHRKGERATGLEGRVRLRGGAGELDVGLRESREGGSRARGQVRPNQVSTLPLGRRTAIT